MSKEICNSVIPSPKTPKERVKNRTPSGTVLTPKVQHISDFFKRKGGLSGLKEGVSWSAQVEKCNSQSVNTYNLRSSQPQPLNANTPKQDFKAKSRALKAASVNKNLGVIGAKTNRAAVNQLINRAEENKLVVRTSPTSSANIVERIVNDHKQQQNNTSKVLHSLKKTWTELNNQLTEERNKLHQSNHSPTKDLTERPITVGHHFKELESYISDMENSVSQDSQQHQLAVDQEHMQTETNDQDNPQVMSVTQVMTMFNKLRIEVEEMKAAQNSTDQQEATTLTAEVLQHFEDTLEAQGKKIQSLQREVGHFKYKSKVLTEVVQRMHIDSEDVMQKIENLEVSGTKRYAVISGLECDLNNKESAIENIEEFFTTNIGVNPEIEDVFSLGGNDSIVIVFQSVTAKKLLFKYKNLLKGVQNSKGKQIYVNEYYPVVTSERKRREKDIKRQCDEDGLDYEHTKYGLKIQNETYIKKVRVPTPEELIDIDLDHLDNVLKLSLQKGEQILEQKSKFVAFVKEIKDYQDVRDLYIKLKLTYPHARHIVCAYWLPGDNIPQYCSKDYCDDNEPGSGRYLLNTLTRNNLQGYALFVNRYYGGQKMGPNRFVCYVNAAQSALINAGLIPESTPKMTLALPKANAHPKQQQQHRRQQVRGWQQQQHNPHTQSPSGENTYANVTNQANPYRPKTYIPYPSRGNRGNGPRRGTSYNPRGARGHRGHYNPTRAARQPSTQQQQNVTNKRDRQASNDSIQSQTQQKRLFLEEYSPQYSMNSFNFAQPQDVRNLSETPSNQNWSSNQENVD